MAEYLIQGKTLTEIADAIRERTGLYNSMKPDAMPAYIRNIKGVSGGGTIDGNAPEDIVKEAERVSVIVNSRDISESIKFIAMSDMHELGDGDTTNSSILEVYRRANLNAGQGAKILADNINPDFYVNLGDFAWGGNSTTIKDGVESIKRAIEYIAGTTLAHDSFLTPGNHDPLTYSYPQNGTYLNYDFVTGLIGTYTYKDFDEKKIRVIVLNTADTKGLTVSYSMGAERMSGEQLQWFAETLDMSSKSDAKDWGIIILSHHPLDWGNILPAANCLQAYLTGTSFSATHNGTSVYYDFSGKNSATVIAQFHGHVHGFKVDYIHHNLDGTMSLTSVNRIAIPNACFARNNEYGENGKEDSNGIEFGESDSYEKVDDSTGKNTAFCAISIDLKKKIIYADCFGSGYDRVVTYGEEEIVSYRVQNNLSNVTTDNTTSIVTEGSPYKANIKANTGYTIETVTVKMGGIDITSTVYKDGEITIDSVTGDIVIYASAVAETVETYVNLVPFATSDGTNIFNPPYGYENGKYLSSSTPNTYSTDASCVATGNIMMDSDVEAIYIKGAAWDTGNSHARFYSGGTPGGLSHTIHADGSGPHAFDTFFTAQTLGTKYYKWTLTEEGKTYLRSRYYRISLVGTGENLIVSHNVPIE